MSRNPRIEALVEAVVNAEEAQPHETARRWLLANSLLDEASITARCTRQALRDALQGHVKEFRSQRRAMEALRLPPKA